MNPRPPRPRGYAYRTGNRWIVKPRRRWPWYVEYPLVLALGFTFTLLIGLIGLWQS
jgi:hypothetical protein